MRDFRNPGDPRRLYDNLTQRLAQKLSRDEAAQIDASDVAVISDMFEQTRPKPQEAQFWLSVRLDGSVIDFSAQAQTRLGALAPGDVIEGLGARLEQIRALHGVVAVPDQNGQMILCVATRPPGARHWTLEEISLTRSMELRETLAVLWRLTPAEVDTSMALLAGETPAETAARTARALGTVRQTVKGVLAKMQVHSSAQAVARLASVALAAREAAMTETARAVRHLLPQRDATGAPIACWRFGSPGGQPVLFFHGALYGVLSTPRLPAMAEMFGVDVIAPERPGYGVTPLPEGRDPIALSIDRARAALDAMGVARVQLHAHDVGSVYAFAFARAFPERVSAILCAPATPPMMGWGQTADMPPLHRVSAFITQKAPGLMETMIKLGLGRVQREGLRAIPQMVFADSAHDREVFSQPACYSLLESIFLSVTEQGGTGFLQDMFVTNLDWSAWLPEITCPVRLFHGALSRTVSLEALRTTQVRLRDARLIVLPDAGHTLPITHAAHPFREALILSAAGSPA